MCVCVCSEVSLCYLPFVAPFSGTLECLSEEAGFDLENPKAAKFRASVMAGNWCEVMMVVVV